MSTDPILASRLREAREYLGFTREQVADALHCPPMLIEGIEAGTESLTGETLRKLSRLYRRPVEWFRGESSFQPSPEMLREVEHLTEGDREAVLDFAEWLQGAGRAPKPSRKLTGEAGDGAHPSR